MLYFILAEYCNTVWGEYCIKTWVAAFLKRYNITHKTVQVKFSLIVKIFHSINNKFKSHFVL